MFWVVITLGPMLGGFLLTTCLGTIDLRSRTRRHGDLPKIGFLRCWWRLAIGKSWWEG